MKIGGLQKLTLIDYPKKIACSIFLFGCNFKCGFCHNPSLVITEKSSENIFKEEILDFLENRKKYLDAVCITGGEPLINKDLPEFLEQIKAKGYSIKIDTNGSIPEMLRHVIEKKLVDFIAMDIKADKDSYDLLAGIDVDIPKIEESIKLIADSGIDYELRTTAVPNYHTPELMKKTAEWIAKAAGKKPKKYVVQKFIPRENRMVDEKFSKIEPFSKEQMEALKEAVKDYFDEVIIRN